MFKKDTQPHYLKHNHHADFETIPAGSGSTMVVDSAGLWDDTNGRYLAWCGKDALKDWFDYIVENLDGTLWFFYGSKFDTHMIFKYMISHGIAVDKEKTMLRGNVLYILGILTKKGTVIVKDLTKFLVGSLDYNCKSFGVEQEYAKTSFDHAKCQNWEDVETYKEERLLYLEQDVKAQRQLYLMSAEAVWKQHSLNLCDFVSMAQMANAITTLYIPEGKKERTLIDGSWILKNQGWSSKRPNGHCNGINSVISMYKDQKCSTCVGFEPLTSSLIASALPLDQQVLSI